ncbi:cobyric acid synthase [Proteinivorax tanatarense]|uniref:Cobyric acid synthase n=1 Tax=Proteinivorax tanatarense TaxID=1260629 RepID=A0AAU7VJ60_9FIRM
MKNKSIMLQGTASSVGKSILSAAICRILTEDGLNVAPFKSQNMSLNSYITLEGHEIGRAQALQAEACRKTANVKMNPILLKPSADKRSQVILNGVVKESMNAMEYYQYKPKLKAMIKEVYNSLAEENDAVVIEGAGSPAEINLKKDDIVNMGMAEMANSPVVLVADIDRGGVFASIYGTLELLSPNEKDRVKGIIINKFRGDKELLKPGIEQIENMVGVPVIGVIPHFSLNLEDEDSAITWSNHINAKESLDVAIIKLPKISNFTDFNPLQLHEGVSLRYVDIDKPLGNPDLIIIPGSKSTISDLEKIKESKMADKILKAKEKGSYIFGICGGFQMLGNKIVDDNMVESSVSEVEGLGLLPIVTEFESQKVTTISNGMDNIFGCSIRGYQIHMGKSKLSEGSYLTTVNSGNGKLKYREGAVNEEKDVFGTYLHGIFDNGEFTKRLLNKVRSSRGKELSHQFIEDFWVFRERELNKLEKIVRENIDVSAVYKIIEEGING